MIVLFHEAGEAEVSDERVTVGGEEDIARFEVAVEDTVLVGVMDGAADIGDETCGP